MARRAIALEYVSLRAISAPYAADIRKRQRRMTAAERRALRESSRLIHADFLAAARRWRFEFSPRERAFMDRIDKLDLTERDHIEMTWRCESLRVLAWALRFIDLPRAHVATLDQMMRGFKGNDPARFLHEAKLRSRRELEYERERSAARVRDDRGRQAPELPCRWEVIGIARLGREYYGDDWSPAVAIARERLHALNWLCGYAPENRWDETPADASADPAVTTRPPLRRTPRRAPMDARAAPKRRRIAVPWSGE